MPQDPLASLGWDAFFESQLERFPPDLSAARVVTRDRGSYLVDDVRRVLAAEVSGRMLYLSSDPSDLPEVGDWVMLRADSGNLAIIEGTLDRKTHFSRNVGRERSGRSGQGRNKRVQVLAANVDVVFIVTAMTREFDRNRIDRYLALIRAGGAEASIILTKADLATEHQDQDQAAALTDSTGVEVFITSAVTGMGLDRLEGSLDEARTYAFVGSSGVGKSTLVNRLLGEDRISTGPVRQDDDRGRHTTTRRQLMTLPSGALVLDTPGLREIGMLEEVSLDESFSDVIALTLLCRFRDCRHRQEPGCAVKQALQDGTLDPKRLSSYTKLEREMAHVRTRNDPHASAQRKAQWKKITKSMRERKNDKV